MENAENSTIILKILEDEISALKMNIASPLIMNIRVVTIASVFGFAICMISTPGRLRKLLVLVPVLQRPEGAEKVFRMLAQSRGCRTGFSELGPEQLN